MSTTLTHIAGRNVKGLSFRHELKPLTVLVGDNAAGKTAITDAVQIALLGYLPALGKKPAATMALAPFTATDLEAEASFSTGASIRRTFTRTKTGASAKTAGVEPEIAASQLAFAEFLNAKPTERHSVLASLMGQIDYEALAEKTLLKRSSLGLIEVVQVAIDQDADRPLDAAIANLANTAKEIKQTVDQSRKTIATLSADTTVPPAIGKPEVEACQDALGKANEAVGIAASEYDALDALVQRAPDEPACAEPTAGDLALAENELAKSRDELAAFGTTDIPGLKAKIAEHKRTIGGLEIRAGEFREDQPTLTSEAIKEARAALEIKSRDLTAEIDKASKEHGAALYGSKDLARQAEQLEGGTCPCCGTTGKALEAAMTAMLDRRSAASKAVTEKGKRLDQMQTTRLEYADEFTKLDQATVQLFAAEAFSKLQETRAAVADLEAKLAQAGDPTIAQRNLAEDQSRLNTLQRNAAEWNDYRAFKHPTTEELGAKAAALVEAREARDKAHKALEDTAAARAKYEQAVADQNRLATMSKKADEDEATGKAVTELRAFLVKEQQAAVAEAMKPLIQTAECFLKGLVNGTMAVEGHLVGIERGGAFLPLEVLSGMEMVAVSAACQAALATQSPIRILLVDELARMTPKNRATFRANCEEAIAAGVIHQAILIDQTAEAHVGSHVIAC